MHMRAAASKLTRMSRRLTTYVTAAAAIAGMLVAVSLTRPDRPPVPAQPIWASTAAAQHRVPASATMGRRAGGRAVQAPAGRAVVPVRGPRGAVPARLPSSWLKPAVRHAEHQTAVPLRAPAAVTKAGYSQRTSRRVPALTSADQLVYANADGTRTAFEFGQPVNRQLPDGSWAAVNTALVPARDGWTQKSVTSPATFGKYADAPELAVLPASGGTVGFGLTGAAHVPGAVRGPVISYRNAVGGADVEFTAGNAMIKEQLILHGPDAPLSWLFPLTLTGGLRARMSKSATIEFVAKNGTAVGYVPHGFMTDANVNPRSGDGAESDGVRYSLAGPHLIKMTLDAGWLRDKLRVFPVTVDPSVSALNSNGTTYAESPYDQDFSGETEIKAGTYNGGGDIARSFLKFDGVGSQLANDKVLGVRLGVFNTWSDSCSPRPVYVYPVTEGWPVTGSKSYPGPSVGAPVGEGSFATGWRPDGSSVSPCPASWHAFNLDQAGTNLVNGWTHGQANNGLAIGASGSDSYGWKKFASVNNPTGAPFLAITYTPYGAGYELASAKPVKQVWPNANGALAIRVTNTGAQTWTPANGYELSYRAYNAQGHLVADHPVFTPMPSSVPPGKSVLVTATVDSLPVGGYALDFDMYANATTSSPVSFSSQGVRPFAVGLNIPDPPPVVTGVYPATGYISPSASPQLSTTAFSSIGNTLSYDFTLTCRPLPGQTCPGTVIDSGKLAVPYWTVPRLAWNTPYTWTVTASDGTTSTAVGPVSITAQVPQPAITASLGGGDGQAFDPLTGDYTTTATDAAVPSAGPPLAIKRTYNSLNAAAPGAFGDGWSGLLDARVTADGDGTGSMLVTLPDGQQIRFGADEDGSFSGPAGNPDVLAHNTDGSWTLVIAGGERYGFAAGGGLTEIIEPNAPGQSLALSASGQPATITDDASGRALHLTWTTAPNATQPHVTSVSTDPPASGQPALTWTYSYTGDQLTGVCDPSGGCTGYQYGTSASSYRDAVLDGNPRSYWQFGDASGSTAADEISSNLGTTDGTYANVTLGGAGPVSGGATSAAFDGSSSSVTLPSGQVAEDTSLSVGLWFKVTPSQVGGVLFGYAADPLSSSSGNTDKHVPALYVGGDGKLYGEFWNGSIDPLRSAASVADGTWHYAVLTASSDTQSLYLDGTLAGTMSGQVDQRQLTRDTVGAGFWQGGWPASYQDDGAVLANTPVGYFDGSIGQVAVYAHPLGLPEIARLHALGSQAAGLLTQVTAPGGDVAAAVGYDTDTGRVASYADADGGQWQLHLPVDTGYKATSDSLAEVLRSVTVRDPAGHDEVYGYDVINGGRQVSYANGVDPPRTFTYDAAGFLNSITDADGNVVTMTNDIRGDVLSRSWYPAEPGTSAARPAAAAASSGSCTTSGAACTAYYTYLYDPQNPLDPTNGKLATVADARSASSADTTYRASYTYNSAGQLTSATTPATSDFPAGRSTTYAYSATGQLLSAKTPGGALTSYSYDSSADLAKLTEPSGRYTTYTYDGLGRPATSTTYTTSYPAGLTTSYAYGPLGKPLTVTHPAVTDPLTGVTHTLQDAYSYDADGNLTQSTQSDLTGGDAARTTSYTYNDHDQVAASTDPAGAPTGYSYDASGNLASKTDADGNTYRYAYNEYGETTQIALYTASTSQASPQAGCTAPATQDADGGCDLVLKSYAYDPAGLLAATTDAIGRITNYGYDHNQDLIAATTTDGSASPTAGVRTSYAYDGAGNVVQKAVTAMSGGLAGTSTITDYNIDAAGRTASVLTDPTPAGTSDSGYANRTTSYSYDADGHVLSAVASDGSQSSATSYTYDAAGDQLTKTVQDSPANQVTSWTYDQSGQPLSMTAPAGNVTSYGYDQAGNQISVTGPPVPVRTYAAQTPATARPVTQQAFDTYGDKVRSQDPDGNLSAVSYDADGRALTATQPSYTPPGGTAITATTSYGYDGLGNLLQVTDPAGNVTKYTYDALGDRTSQTDPQLAGQSAPGTWHYGYDWAGEQTSVTNPDNATTTATYDYFGNLATSTDPLHATTSYSHDYLGDVTKIAQPDGTATTSSYDHLGELTTATDAAGNKTSYTYNYLGKLAQVGNPDLTMTGYGYDQAGNRTSVTDYGSATPPQVPPALRTTYYGYDTAGNQVSVKDPDGNTTTSGYDAAGHLTSTTTPVTATTSITTSYGYDAAGNQTAVTDGNNNTTWTTYNSWNLPESVIKPAATAGQAAADRTWTTSYDPDQQPVAVAQPGGITVTYGYDALGNMTAEAGTNTPAQTRSYDPAGRLTGASAPGGTDTFSYNADGNLAGTTGPSGTASFGYDTDQRMTTRADAAGTTTYTYSDGQLATLSDPLTGAKLSYTYNADSQPQAISYGSGGPTVSYGYDQLQRQTSQTLTAASGSQIAAASYVYDPDGNMTSRTTAGFAGAGTTGYGYDFAGRLTSAGGTAYSYDGDGNMTQAGASTDTYNAQDQLTSSTGASGTTNYAYTPAGTLSSVSAPGGSTSSYTSNALGQVVAAPGGITYAYDALGRLATRTDGNGSASFAYSGTGATLASDGGTRYSHDPSSGLVAAQAGGGAGQALLTDTHGDVTGAFSPAAGTTSLTASAAYGPYGSVTAASGPAAGLGYQGDYTDPATGQVDMSARWYDPATGGFTSADTINGSPVPAAADDSSYAYANNNPVSNTDPTGHFCEAPGELRLVCGAVDVGEAVKNGGGVVKAVEDGGWGGLLGGFSEKMPLPGLFQPAPAPTHWFARIQADLARIAQVIAESTTFPGYAGESPVTPWYPWYPPPGPPGGPGGGGCGWTCAGPVVCLAVCYRMPPLAPPPPPPPPQDVYNSAHPKGAPSVPPWMKTSPYITQGMVKDVANIAKLFGSGPHVFELPPVPATPAGIDLGSALILPIGSGGHSINRALLDQPIGGLAVPQTPTAGGRGIGNGGTGVVAPGADDPGGDDPGGGDPDEHEYATRVILGAGIGAAAGMLSGIIQGQPVRQVLQDGVIGGIAGAFQGIPEGVAANAGVGAGAGLVTSLVNQTMSNGGLTGIKPSALLTDTLIGGILPGLGRIDAQTANFTDKGAAIYVDLIEALATEGCASADGGNLC